MNRSHFNRRTLLRGMIAGTTVGVGLPLLESMLDRHGEALAQGRPLPKRFGVWFWGNGVRRAQWTPNGTGSGWTPREEMQPLLDAGLRTYLSPITGCEIKTATHPHHSGMAGIMTGQRYHQLGTTRDTIVTTFARQSIDQYAADHVMADAATRTRYRSLELGVCRFHGTDEGTTFQHLSHNGPNNPNQSEYSPLSVYQRLFAMSGAPQVALARQSVLSAIQDDIRALQSQVSASDRIRLEQHFDSVRAIEARLAAPPPTCATPMRPLDSYPDDMGREAIEAKNRVMSDLLALALACDLTRVFSVQFSTCGAGTVFWMVPGLRNGMHQQCHDERASADPATQQPMVHAATTFTMQQLAYFLTRLRDTPEGTTNVLHNSTILCTTELSEGYAHTNDEYPILLAGRGGGSLRGNYHWRSGARDNTSRALLTALRSFGHPAASYGVAEGASSSPIAELLV
ncbi:MAG: DUF1552 domain-containing protein [Deltaproteobacteria bacterium]|nr:DUF1552 domain-containing protein [Deltaproteobacteria bacterium]